MLGCCNVRERFSLKILSDGNGVKIPILPQLSNVRRVSWVSTSQNTCNPPDVKLISWSLFLNFDIADSKSLEGG